MAISAITPNVLRPIEELFQLTCGWEDYPKLNPGWLIGMSNEGKELDLQNYLPNLQTHRLVLDDFILPTYDSHTYVGWDQGKVASIDENPLFSKEFGSCIALLGRGIKEGENRVSHTSLNHVFVTPKSIEPTLLMLIEKVKSGIIELFITGGLEQTKNNKSQMEKIIHDLGKINPNVELMIKDDTFKIADSEMGIYQIAGIKYVAFDRNGNPYQIIGS